MRSASSSPPPTTGWPPSSPTGEPRTTNCSPAPWTTWPSRSSTRTPNSGQPVHPPRSPAPPDCCPSPARRHRVGELDDSYGPPTPPLGSTGERERGCAVGPPPVHRGRTRAVILSRPAVQAFAAGPTPPRDTPLQCSPAHEGGDVASAVAQRVGHRYQLRTV